MSKIAGLAGFMGRLYLQFIIIIVMAFLLSIILNPIFMNDNHEIRIMLTSLILMGFTGSILIIRKI